MRGMGWTRRPVCPKRCAILWWHFRDLFSLRAKGSCGLEYRLVEIPSKLRGGNDPSYPGWFSRWFYGKERDLRPTSL